MNSLISVIIPCYNVSQTIQSCLKSLRLQTYDCWEAICIDDGSIDSTTEIIDVETQSDNRIRLYSQVNMGAAKAREVGVLRATGDYILFLDADDTLISSALETLLDVFNKDTQMDIVVSGFNMIKNGKIVKRKAPRFNQIDSLSYLKRVLCGKNGWELCAKMYKRILFDQSLYIPQNLKSGEDVAVFIQLICRSKMIGGCNTPIYNYIQHDASASHIRSIEYAEDTIKAAQFVETILKKNEILDSVSTELDIMFLLSYSNSTRKFRLGKRHPLVKFVKNHVSIAALLRLPFYRVAYIILFYYWGGFITNLFRLLR